MPSEYGAAWHSVKASARQAGPVLGSRALELELDTRTGIEIETVG